MTATETVTRAVPKHAKNALTKRNITLAALTGEQRERAETCDEQKPGLRGKELGAWILDGDPQPEPEPEPEPVAAPTARKPKARKRGVSAMQHVEDVLAETGRPMHQRALADAAIERDRATGQPTLNGKTPAATIAAKLVISARDGGVVERVGPGVFALRAWTPEQKRQDPVVPDGLRRHRSSTLVDLTA